MLLIEGGRHPLAEVVVQDTAVIPNPVTMLPDRQRVHVITGRPQSSHCQDHPSCVHAQSACSKPWLYTVW